MTRMACGGITQGAAQEAQEAIEREVCGMERRMRASKGWCGTGVSMSASKCMRGHAIGSIYATGTAVSSPRCDHHSIEVDSTSQVIHGYD